MTIVETPTGFELDFEYRPKIVAEVKAIQGVRFYSKQKIWFVPKGNEAAVDKLRRKYCRIAEGSDAPEEVIKVNDMPDLEIDLPLKLPPFPYQAQGIAQGMQFKRFINGDQPGLGKTLSSIGTVLGENAFPCLVICPATLKENWRREWSEKFTDKRAMILSDANKNTWHQYWRMGMADVFIVNYESLKKYFVDKINKDKNGRVTLAGIDFYGVVNLFKRVSREESHRLKDPTTLQSKFVAGIAKGKDLVICLTGTPIVNKPKDMLSQLAVLGRLHEFGGRKFFLDRYCQGGSGAANLSELNAKLRNICFFRREKKDVLTDLPDKMREIALCDIDNREEYTKAISDFKKYLTDLGLSAADIRKKLRGEVMVKIGMLKSISAMGKLGTVIEKVNEVVDAGEKIVLFCHRKIVAEALMNAFPGAVTVRGDDDRDSRQRAIDKFQTDPDCKVIICSIKAAGVGLTLTASSRVAFVELPWHAADVEQCEDRCHRIGQKNSVQVIYFLGKDTIDEKIYKIIEKKREIANTVTGTEDEIETLINDITRTLFNQAA